MVGFALMVNKHINHLEMDKIKKQAIENWFKKHHNPLHQRVKNYYLLTLHQNELIDSCSITRKRKAKNMNIQQLFTKLND